MSKMNSSERRFVDEVADTVVAQLMQQDFEDRLAAPDLFELAAMLDEDVIEFDRQMREDISESISAALDSRQYEQYDLEDDIYQCLHHEIFRAVVRRLLAHIRIPRPRDLKMIEIVGVYCELETKSRKPPTLEQVGERVGQLRHNLLTHYIPELVELGLLDEEPRGDSYKQYRASPYQLDLWRRRHGMATVDAVHMSLVVVPAGQTSINFEEVFEETVGEDFSINSDLLPPDVDASRLYALQVDGNSMIDALIADGDIAVIQPYPQDAAPNNGDVVVGRIRGDEVTLKRFYAYPNDTHVILDPANEDIPPIRVPKDDFVAQGKVVLIVRRVSAIPRRAIGWRSKLDGIDLLLADVFQKPSSDTGLAHVAEILRYGGISGQKVGNWCGDTTWLKQFATALVEHLEGELIQACPDLEFRVINLVYGLNRHRVVAEADRCQILEMKPDVIQRHHDGFLAHLRLDDQARLRALVLLSAEQV